MQSSVSASRSSYLLSALQQQHCQSIRTAVAQHNDGWVIPIAPREPNLLDCDRIAATEHVLYEEGGCKSFAVGINGIIYIQAKLEDKCNSQTQLWTTWLSPQNRIPLLNNPLAEQARSLTPAQQQYVIRLHEHIAQRRDNYAFAVDAIALGISSPSPGQDLQRALEYMLDQKSIEAYACGNTTYKFFLLVRQGDVLDLTIPEHQALRWISRVTNPSKIDFRPYRRLSPQIQEWAKKIQEIFTAQKTLLSQIKTRNIDKEDTTTLSTQYNNVQQNARPLIDTLSNIVRENRTLEEITKTLRDLWEKTELGKAGLEKAKRDLKGLLGAIKSDLSHTFGKEEKNKKLDEGLTFADDWLKVVNEILSKC